MWSRRRIAIAAGVAAVPVIGCGIAWAFWLPAIVESKIVEAAAERGLQAEVDSVHIGLGSLTLEGLHASGRHALELDVDRIELDAGPWALATSGTAAVEQVQATGVHVRVSLDDPSLTSQLDRLRGPRREETAGRSSRHIRVEQLSIDARDADGPLLAMQGGTVNLDPENLRVAFGPIHVAPDAQDGADIATVHCSLGRTDEGWRVSSADAREVQVRYREREGDAQSPLWARVRRHARLFAQRAASSPTPAPNRSGFDSVVDLAERLGAYVATGSVLRVEDLSVVAHNDDDQRVLRDMNAELRVLEGERYRFEGSGRPGRGGRLGWHLTLMPAELRAEGDIDFERVPFVLLVPFLPDLPWDRSELTRVSGSLAVRGRGAERMHLEGEVSIEDLALSSARIAPSPVRHIALSMRGQADWIPEQRRLEIASMQMQVGRALATLQGSLEWPHDHYMLDLRAVLPPTSCNTAVAAIPVDLLQDTAGFSWDGVIGGRIVARIDSRDLDATVLDIDVANGCRFLTAPGMADVTRFEGPFDHRVVEPDGRVFEMETGPGTAAWTPLSRISPFMVHAVLGHEDSGFFSHRGFAVHAIRDALVRNLREGRYAYGASTITMQLVKNVFLHREKTLARKVQEVLLTWWIESAMDKQSIIQLYLNVIEYGPDVYGIRNAAAHYFGCTPDQLTPAQSAYLAMILPNPTAFHSQWEQGQIPDSFRRRVARFVRLLGERGRYDAEAVVDGLGELEHFRLVRPGESPACRRANGHATPLPVAAGQPDDQEPVEEEPETEEDSGWDEW